MQISAFNPSKWAQKTRRKKRLSRYKLKWGQSNISGWLNGELEKQVHTRLTGQIWDHFKIKLDHIQAPKQIIIKAIPSTSTSEFGRAQKLVATQF